MGFVVDASMTCAWVLPDEVTSGAEAVLELAATTEVFVPSVWRADVMNSLVQVCRRGGITEENVLKFWMYLDRLGIHESAYSAPSQQILTLCRAYGLTGYQSQYVALAKWMKMLLATVDPQLAAAARREGVDVLGS